MARHVKSLSADYFETMFQETEDPWNLETSPYEQDKFDDSLHALAGRTYSSGFEVGCAKGVLSLKLANSCRSLLSIDVSDTALDAARSRVGGREHVVFNRMAFPLEAPADTFDLVVLSEVAYYWDDDDLARGARWLGDHLRSGGDVLLVHYIGETDYPQSGDDAVFKLWQSMTIPLEVVEAHRRERYRLDLWRRAS